MATVNGSRHVEVTKQAPCKICGAHKQCKIAEDGAIARCYRVADGAFDSRAGSDGRNYHLHRLTGDGGSAWPILSLPSKPKSDKDADRIPIAPVETRHEVYTALLSLCILQPRHRIALAKRGLTDEQIDRAQYGSLVSSGWNKTLSTLEERFSKEVLLTIPGFFAHEKTGKISLAAVAGLLIPVRNAGGQIIGMKTRPDKSVSGGSKYFWLSSSKRHGPGSGAPIHVPIGSPAQAEVWRITEGELKSDIAAALSGIPTLSAPGSGIWRPTLPILKDAGCQRVILAFDADAWQNKQVAADLAACYTTLRSEGYEVEIERWPEDHKGIDDALAAGVTPEILSGEKAKAAVIDAAGFIPDGSESPAVQVAATRAQQIRAKVKYLVGDSEADFATLLRDKTLLQDLAWLKTNDPGEFGANKSDLKTLRNFHSRDFDAALKPFLQKKRPETASGARQEYSDTGEMILVKIQPPDGEPVVELLSRFSARIVEALTYDDGGACSKKLKIEAKIQDVPGTRTAEVPAKDYESMGWVVEQLGPEAIIMPGRQLKDLLRHGIQELSRPIPGRTIYQHTGWRKVEDEWRYLHAGGAIGHNGNDPGVAVDVKGYLPNFCLPDPPTGEARVKAIQASLGILRLGQKDRPMSRAVAAALLSVAYRAAIRQSNFSLQANGLSGTFKSSSMALAQQHFGPGMHAQALPASWKSSVGRLEYLLYAAKDAFLTVDDFVPAGSSRDVDNIHRTAEAVFRSQGNNQGRQRLNSDGSPQPDRNPRGTMGSTGEDMNRTRSANARTLPLPYVKDDAAKGVRGTIDPDILSKCQADANAGLYASSMAAFLQWMAPQHDAICEQLTAKCLELRGRATQPGDHGRLPDIIADLAAGFEFFLTFAIEAGAITKTEAEAYRETVWIGLDEAATDAREDQQEEADAGEVFTSLMVAVLTSGTCYLADVKGGDIPLDLRPAAGWRQVLKWQGNDLGQVPEWEPGPNAKRIGWTDGLYVYLEPKNSYLAAQSFAGQQGQAFPVAPTTLWKLLHAQKKLALTDPRNKSNEGKGRLTYRKQLEGKQHNVIVMRCSEFWPESDDPNGVGSDEVEGEI